MAGFTKSLQHNGPFSTPHQHREMEKVILVLSNLDAEDVRGDLFQTHQLINVPNVSDGKLPQSMRTLKR